MRLFFRSFCILCCTVLLITGCQSYDFARRVVQQGNLLPQEKIDRLKVGMHKNDVAILMGTSLLSPLFNEQRWDYVYRWQRGQGPLIKRHVSIYFVNDEVSRIEYHPE